MKDSTELLIDQIQEDERKKREKQFFLKQSGNDNNKEKLRRIGVRLRTLFKIKRNKYDSYLEPVVCSIPNFWYTPFEVYVLAHIKRAHFIMTCNEYAYVDASVERAKYTITSPFSREWNNKYVTEKFEKRLSDFAERVKRKDEERNENKNI